MPAIILVGHSHNCPRCGLTTVTSGAKSVTINNRPVACVGDHLDCGAVIVSGSSLMMIAGSPVARAGDLTNHGGVLENEDNCWKID
ncbi:PAAR domain-containing protein [Pseudomonas peradeniyensis]|uniref:PAAR domain-containing protein n=1 Tax=Pseudomonas TaxID=286 RepID=UPI0009E9A85F|nr:MULTISPECIES: PAAR domain-containing protein [Pseudomonas]MCU7281099.1 PAAR domain-containing protein [Pseudomonas peradeniyensis]QZA52783.1 PAAR domain-containing protein [Pseudomonas sp. 2hn]